MAAELVSWLELAFRWLHVVTAIAWIGASFYFVWLDGHLVTPTQPKEGVAGEVWAVHGGGFYHNQKYLVAPAQMPPGLHWFKYEAYFTWISGFLLLCVIYYWGAGIYLIDSAKHALTPPEAVAIGLACLAGGWLVYDGLCKSPLGRDGMIFGTVWFAILVATAYGLTRIFSDRGAFIHVGAIVGTVMVANVFFIIIPNQKIVVADLIAGRTPDPRLGLQAKQRSLHNNYMTLPVVLLMISNHYPIFVASRINWLLLALLSLCGVMIRHFFNLRHKGRISYDLAIGALAVFVFTAWLASDVEQRLGASLNGAPRVSYAQARAILDTHCVMCHSASPTHAGITSPPAGLDFTRDDIVKQNAARIMAQAVHSKTMPLGNETHMTDAERATLGAWISQGARP